jgi:hypothetical protein
MKLLVENNRGRLVANNPQTDKYCSIDQQSLTTHTMKVGDVVEGSIKTITPKNGNKPFDVFVVTNVLPFYDGEVFSRFEGDKVITKMDTLKTSDTDDIIGINKYEQNHTIAKIASYITSIKGLTMEMVEAYKAEYLSTRKKYAKVHLQGGVEVTDESISFRYVTEDHFGEGTNKEYHTAVVPVSSVVRVFNKPSCSHFCIQLKGLEELLDCELIKNDSCLELYAYEKEVSTSWLSYKKDKITKEIGTKKLTIGPITFSVIEKRDYEVSSFTYNSKQVFFNENTYMGWGSYNLSSSVELLNYIITNFFSLNFKDSSNYIDDMKKLAKGEGQTTLGRLLALAIVIKRREGTSRVDGDIIYDLKNILDYEVTSEQLQELQILIGMSYFPNITEHNFNTTMKKFLLKNGNEVTICNPRMENGKYKVNQVLVAFDLPTNSTSAEVGFKFYPKHSTGQSNGIQYQASSYSYSSGETYRWGSISSSSSTREFRMKEENYLHLGVNNKEEFEAKFSPLYSKLDDVWNTLPDLSLVYCFPNIINHIADQTNTLAEEVYTLMQQYHVEVESESGGMGFWCAD